MTSFFQGLQFFAYKCAHPTVSYHHLPMSGESLCLSARALMSRIFEYASLAIFSQHSTLYSDFVSAGFK